MLLPEQACNRYGTPVKVLRIYKMINTRSLPNEKKIIQKNRSIPDHVSSTFRDMIEDRNALMSHCWPD
jgi:hypothetical protein